MIYNVHLEKFFIFDGLLEVFLLNWQMLFISITNIPFWKQLNEEFLKKNILNRQILKKLLFKYWKVYSFLSTY
jgi:hypothetical protein